MTAPAPGAKVPYGVQFSWQGADLDGTVGLYRFVIDPPALGLPYWIETISTSQFFFFRATTLDLPVPSSGPITFSDPHTLTLKAVDNDGLESDPASRAFFASTIAPDVQLVSPVPNSGDDVPIGTEVIIGWQGTDSDGHFFQRPVKYKYLLTGAFSDFPGGIAAAWANPSAFRDWYAPGFAGWDSTSSDTLSVHYTNLNPGSRYLFCVVGFDEAGAYSARFGRAVNMIQMMAGVTPTRRTSWGQIKSMYR
ncbi:MAG: hypothetical protein ACRENS_11195 [Candidatus Eiseniibacteriota bacterium]